MNNYIDLYCERVLPGLLDEPLNAVSNISFLIAAWFIWQLAQKQYQKIPAGIYILTILAFSIGIGSTLFHTFANRLSYFLDVIPILIFQLCFLSLYSRQVMKMKYFAIGLLIVGFLFMSGLSRQFTYILNGSLSYAPAFLIISILGFYHYQQNKNEPLVLCQASGTLMLALLFRTIDQIVCPYFSHGTHFMWHLLCGVLLYLSARGLILNWSDKVVKN